MKWVLAIVIIGIYGCASKQIVNENPTQGQCTIGKQYVEELTDDSSCNKHLSRQIYCNDTNNDEFFELLISPKFEPDDDKVLIDFWATQLVLRTEDFKKAIKKFLRRNRKQQFDELTTLLKDIETHENCKVIYVGELPEYRLAYSIADIMKKKPFQVIERENGEFRDRVIVGKIIRSHSGSIEFCTENRTQIFMRQLFTVD